MFRILAALTVILAALLAAQANGGSVSGFRAAQAGEYVASMMAGMPSQDPHPCGNERYRCGNERCGASDACCHLICPIPATLDRSNTLDRISGRVMAASHFVEHVLRSITLEHDPPIPKPIA
jgi:hypothetical protein